MWGARRWTGLSNREMADLFSVSERKLDRWFAGESEPPGEDEQRLRIAARVVGQLRHAMTAFGSESPSSLVNSQEAPSESIPLDPYEIRMR